MTFKGLAMRVWVGCMTHYSAGQLIGEWMDAAEAARWRCPLTRSDRDTAYLSPDAVRWTPDAGWADDRPTYGVCEEYRVLDTDEMPVNSEMSPAQAAKWAELFDMVEPNEQRAFADYVQYHSMDADQAENAREEFRDSLRGQHDSLEAFAHEEFEERNPEFVKAKPWGCRIEICLPDWESEYWISDHGYVFGS